MDGKKALLSKAILSTQIYRILYPAASFCLTVLNYHRIRPNSRSFEPRFDSGVYGVTAYRFEEQMRWLRENYRILSEKDLIEFRNGKRLPMKPSVLVTFDDGYKDNYTLAYPILKKYAIPAMFFIPFTAIEKRELGWWDLIAYMIKRSEKSAISIKNKRYDLRKKKENTITSFHEQMATFLSDDTSDLIERLSEECEVPLPTRNDQSEELMTWDEIKTVSQNGITIGSHTLSHRVLATLSAEEQFNELTQAKKKLESKLSTEVKSIAYPVGGYQHFTKQTKKLSEAAGYKLAFSFNTGVNRFLLKDPYDIRRVSPLESMPMFISSCVLPEVFFWRT